MRAGSALVVVGVTLAAAPSAARTHHRHTPAPPAPAAATAPPHSFYPETVEGGVPGNLTFNNQIRKHTDPLNANGGK